MRKGIILSGGLGTRLYPCTEVVSKQLLPVYNKPLVYYPLSTLMLSGIRDILIVTSPKDRLPFERLFGAGAHLGLDIRYETQHEPRGIAESFIIGKRFIGNDDVTLVLGDNIFYGNDFIRLLENASSQKIGCTLFAYHVSDPERFGVLEYDSHKRPCGIIEKPEVAPSNHAVTGLYYYDNSVVEYAKQLSPSKRGELEITDINNIYLKSGRANIQYMNRGFAWMDTGTFESLSEASTFIESVEKRTGMMIGCPEEIAFKNGWIDIAQLQAASTRYQKSDYGKYLKKIIDEVN
jgi:glucose-1-phosphate thymidylyltransferase